MNKRKYFYVLLSLLYFELVFHLFMYDNYLRSSIINILLFCLINSFIIYMYTSVWYSLHYIFYSMLQSPFSLSLLALSDQAATFSKNVVIGILENFYIMVLLFIPLILFIVFRKKMFYKRIMLKETLISSGL